MKWVLLGIALAGVLPLSAWLRSKSGNSDKIWMIVGFLVLEHGPLHLYMALDSWAGSWPGYTFGAEISLLDLIILAIYLSLPRGKNQIPFKLIFAFYFFAVLLSALQAIVPMLTLFYAWQLVRVFFVYAVIARASIEPRVTDSLLKGLAIGLLFATCLAMWDRFGLGTLRTAGGFSSENFLGLVSHFIVFPFFALLLAGERGWLPGLISLAGMVIAILTTSRATVALDGFGYIAVLIISALRGWTPMKTKVAAIGVIVVVIIAPLFVSSFGERFSTGIVSNFFGVDDSRVQMSEAASMMLSDHPMGVGANQYVVVANSQGYNERAGLNWVNNKTFVHNVYWLVAAETGYIGLIAFVILLSRPIIVALRCGWRYRKDKRADLMLGVGVGLLIVCLHSFYEWIFVSFQVQYIFAACVGLIAGLAQQLNYWSRSRSHSIQFENSNLIGSTAKVAQNNLTKLHPRTPV